MLDLVFLTKFWVENCTKGIINCVDEQENQKTAQKCTMYSKKRAVFRLMQSYLQKKEQTLSTF